MPRRSSLFLTHTAVSVYMLLLLATLPRTHATPILVTVQTQSQEQLDTLTQAIETDAQTEGEAGSVRHLLGSIEATQLHVYDVDNPYTVTSVQSMTLSLLENIQYDTSTAVWTLTYDTMAIMMDVTVPEQINHWIVFCT